MDANLIEQLLWQEESEYLDFKRAQYRFYGADEADKGELLKDILAFANAWRQTDAYILVGVNEVRGGRSQVVGVAAHLKDNDIQQFVNSKTQRPVVFSYAAATFEGAQVGIIRIPQQPRPIYLLEAYGQLAPKVVYVRRGSATVEAAPDEVARMGASTKLLEGPVLVLEHLDIRTKKPQGATVEISCEVLHLPLPEDIPVHRIDYPSDLLRSPSFLKELAHYLRAKALLQPVGLVVTNLSGTTATNVRAIVEISRRSQLTIVDQSEIPPRPRSEISVVASPWLRGLALARPFEKYRRIDVEVEGDNWIIAAEFGSVQPKAVVRTQDVFYIGAFESMQVMMEGAVFADNLPDPMKVSLTIAVTVADRELSLDDLKRIGNEIAEAED